MNRHDRTAFDGPPVPALSARATIVFALAAALSVGCVYASQPMLDSIGNRFHMAGASLGVIVMVTQIGYALGLIALVPIGDAMNRRRLIIGQISLSVVALIVVATATNRVVLIVGLFVVGMLAVVVQTLVAFAASLAPRDRRGTVVGTITGGIVIGILVSRFAAGVITDLAGWRAVYAGFAGALALTLVFLVRMLPDDRKVAVQYLAVLRSMPALVMGDRVFRVRAFFAFAIFAAFSAFWTGLVLPLQAAPYHYDHARIGLFGLVGVVGALAARGAGRLVDRGQAETVTGGALIVLSVSWLMIALLPLSLVALVVGVVLLDLAVQAVHVTSQTMLVTRHPDAQSRAIAGYMVFYSLGSAAGAFGATHLYSALGWSAVCALGLAFSLAGLAVWALEWLRKR